MTEPLERPDRGGLTFHLTPAEVWERQASSESYVPEAFATDGFIHCTDGEANLRAVANAFYQTDHRPQVVLVIDLSRVIAPVRYEDPARIYPHIYGPLNRDAVVAVHQAERAPDGSFAAVV